MQEKKSISVPARSKLAQKQILSIMADKTHLQQCKVTIINHYKL